MVQRLAAVAASVLDHTEACRVRLEKALADERADPVKAPVGPNTQSATESQESAPTSEKLDSEEVQNTRAKEVPELDEFEVKNGGR